MITETQKKEAIKNSIDEFIYNNKFKNNVLTMTDLYERYKSHQPTIEYIVDNYETILGDLILHNYAIKHE